MGIDARNIAELLTDIVAQSTSALADSLARRLSKSSRRHRAILARCRATTDSGAQCKRRPVAGSDYCHQHRNRAKADGGMFIVIEARNKAAKATSEFSRMTRTAAARATTRLAAISPTVRAEVLPFEGVAGLRQSARRAVTSLMMRRPWLTPAITLALITVVSIVILRLANVDLNSVVGFASESDPSNSVADGRDLDQPSGGESSTDRSNSTELLTSDRTYALGTDFRGAYILGVEHLSQGRSMLEIFVPAGVEGNYQAVVTASEGLEFQCVILHHYTDRLYCIGARLADGSQVNVRIFRIDEDLDSERLVFETDYTMGEVAPPPVPTQPAFVPYGGGFTWPDRFDGIERQREIESSKFLWPLSTISGAAAFWLLLRIRRDLLRTNRLIEHRASTTY